MKKNYFITIEGVEGAGKSTAMKFVSQLFKDADIPLVVTREPGGTQIGDAIRHVLLSNYDEPMSYDTELLLMFASRAQNLERIIKPALKAGKWVLCDRFTDASYAYQGGGRGINLQRIAQLEKWVHEDLQPDLVLLLDVPVEIGFSRIEERKAKDRIEQEQMDFFNRVRNGYLDRAKEFAHRYKIIDASGSILEVEKQLKQILKPLLIDYLQG